MVSSILNLAAVLVLAPFLLGVINRTKALVAGRTGPPLLQAYFDVAKLLRKGFVFERDDDVGVPRGSGRLRRGAVRRARSCCRSRAAPRCFRSRET